MKILYIIGSFVPGGAEKQLFYLCKFIDKRKFSPVVIGLRGGKFLSEFENLGIPVYVLEKKWKIDMKVFLKLIKIIKNEKPDILHTFMFTANTWGRIAGIICKVPVIIASERSTDKWKKNYHFLIDRILLKFTEKIICNCEEVKRVYLNKIGSTKEKYEVIYNGIDINLYDEIEKKENFKKEFGIENEKIIIAGGRLSIEKNLECFLLAGKKILEKFKDVKFLIVGEGDEKEKLINLSKKLGIGKNVIFTGYKKDLPYLLKISDILVLSSLWEGFPNMVLEAMACKKPVISTDVGGLKEIIKDGVNGFLLPVNSPEEIAEKAIFLLRNPDISEKMGKQGYEMIKNRFSIKKMVNEYQKIYLKLIEKFKRL